MKILEILKYVAQNSNTAFFYTPPIYSKSSCYFFNKVETQIKIFSNDDVEKKLKLIDKALENDLTAFGFASYEFGYLLEQKLEKLIDKNNNPLLHLLFCNSNSLEKVDSSSLDFTGIEELIGKQIIEKFRLNTSEEKYKNNVRKIKDYISKGDTYQVNYTINSKFNLVSSVEQLFAQLIFSQSAQYSAIINLGDRIIISASPELFFEIENDRIKVQPMKGTIKRGKNVIEDDIRKNELLDSEKDRAENIMIVDLLRNDLGKICEYDSVEVTSKYNLQTYESIHQLTSDVKGKLNKMKFSDVVMNLFPSGSITGAPKIRTMEIINKLELEKRGVYTGLIGIFNKNYSIANVAIRTISINSKTKKGTLGIGSGIVWDSDPMNEYNEVILKSKFLNDPLPYFILFETMLFENEKIFLLDYHLRRLKMSSEYFLFKYEEVKIKSELNNAVMSLDNKSSYKIKLVLKKWGSVTITIEKIESSLSDIDIVVSDKRIDSENRYQYFKTTNRQLYDEELTKYKQAGYSEVIYLNEMNHVAEGSFTNILLENDDELITPPISDGILNGCYRQYLLASNSKLIEKHVDLNKLINAKRIILINSVRKEITVRRVFDSENKLLRNFRN